MPVLVSAYFRARRADGTHPRSAAACAISPDPRRFAGHRRGRRTSRAAAVRAVGKRQFVVVGCGFGFGLAVLAPTAARPASHASGPPTATPRPPRRAAQRPTRRHSAAPDRARRPSSRSSAIRPARRWAGWNLGFAVCAQAARHLPRPAAAGGAGTRGPTAKYRERRPRTDRCPALAYPRPLPRYIPDPSLKRQIPGGAPPPIYG